MKELLGEGSLLNRWTGEWEKALIFQGLDDKNLEDFEKCWKPVLDKRAAEFANWDEQASGNVQDAHWDWVGKARQETVYETFAIECDGMTQGLMLVDLTTRFARLPSQKGLDIAYIELISTAPWNRVKFSDKPKYRGAGIALIATAISYSVSLEFKGRLALHSLPESVSWYEPLGFTDHGHDAQKDMKYFEMTEEQATEFLKSQGGQS